MKGKENLLKNIKGEVIDFIKRSSVVITPVERTKNYNKKDYLMFDPVYDPGFEPVWFFLEHLFGLNSGDWGDDDDFNPTFDALVSKSYSSFINEFERNFKDEIDTINEYKTPEIIEFMENNFGENLDLDLNVEGINGIIEQLTNFMDVTYYKGKFYEGLKFSDFKEILKEEIPKIDYSDAGSDIETVEADSEDIQIIFYNYLEGTDPEEKQKIKTLKSHTNFEEFVGEKTRKAYSFLEKRYSIDKQKILFLSFFLNFIENPFITYK